MPPASERIGYGNDRSQQSLRGCVASRGLGDIFGSDFFKAFLIFLASFFGSKHGTANGSNGNSNGH